MATLCLRTSLCRYLRQYPVCGYSTAAGYNVPKRGDKVVVGMSGGVDSSVAAKLLADQDYDLSAVFMRNWDTRDESGSDKGCEWEKDWEDVQLVCKVLDIPCKMVDLSREYWTRVFEPSLKAWELGVTPNPDVWCNKEIKFGALLERLPMLTNAPSNAWFATGHYARKAWSTPSLHTPARPKLLSAADRIKDQSYYLSSISEQALRPALFPLENLTKPEVRELAKKYLLPTADRAESMGLCFVGEKVQFSRFLSSYLPPSPGPILDLESNCELGKHAGLWTYTIGQNAGIGGLPVKMFVAKKDTNKNTLYVVPGSNHEALFATDLHIRDFSWIWSDAPPAELSHSTGFRAHVKFRHRMESVPCTVHRSWTSPDHLSIHFDQPQKAAAPGQVAALWDRSGDEGEAWCLGCGIILHATSMPEAMPARKEEKKRNETPKNWRWWSQTVTRM